MKLRGWVRLAPGEAAREIEVLNEAYRPGLEQLEAMVPEGHQLIAVLVDRDATDPREL